MQKQLFGLLLALFFGGFLRAGLAAALPMPAAPKIGATAHYLVDFHSGQVLASEQEKARMAPASLTKMMTAYVVFAELRQGNISLGDSVPISEKAWRMGGSRMFIEVGKRVPVEELLKGVIIQSGNDASVALAEFVAGSEDAFAQLMNQYVEKLGMTDSHFVNATGLPDPEHYSSALDLATLARALIRDFPEHYSWHRQRSFVFNGITQYNRNKLLWRDESVDGVKTGHTDAAGYCLVASAERKGMRLISVVLGTDSEKARARHSQTLLNYGFRFFETHKLYGAAEGLANPRVWQGDVEHLELGLQAPLYVTIPRGQYKSLKANMEIDARIVAPVSKGQSRGLVRVNLGDTVVAERQLVALHPVAEGGWWQQLSDRVWLMFE